MYRSLQCWKELFRAFACQLQIQGITGNIDVAPPHEISALDSDFAKGCFVAPFGTRARDAGCETRGKRRDSSEAGWGTLRKLETGRLGRRLALPVRQVAGGRWPVAGSRVCDATHSDPVKRVPRPAFPRRARDGSPV
ncbi:MAG: hypothetical protein KY459_12010 [Acidobacteria bacterium]|nr:hypothetical protein [Acidobacteriota bacterium]